MRLIRLRKEHNILNTNEFIGVGAYTSDPQELDALLAKTILQPYTPYLKPRQRYSSLEGHGWVAAWELPRLRGQIRLFKLAYYLALGQLRLKEHEDSALSAAEREQQLTDKFHRQLVHERNRNKRKAKQLLADKASEKAYNSKRRAIARKARIVEKAKRDCEKAKLDYCQARIREYSTIKDLLT